MNTFKALVLMLTIWNVSSCSSTLKEFNTQRDLYTVQGDGVKLPKQATDAKLNDSALELK